MEIKREKQEDINKKAQQPVDNWMNNQLKSGKPTKSNNEKEDEFFF